MSCFWNGKVAGGFGRNLPPDEAPIARNKKSEACDLALGKNLLENYAAFFTWSFFQVRRGALVTRPFLMALAATRM